jgi:hypothetical protein
MKNIETKEAGISGNSDQQNGFSKFYARLHRPWMKSDTGWIYTLLAAALILLAGLINYDA